MKICIGNVRLNNRLWRKASRNWCLIRTKEIHKKQREVIKTKNERLNKKITKVYRIKLR
jgi:hypothetical protein